MTTIRMARDNAAQFLLFFVDCCSRLEKESGDVIISPSETNFVEISSSTTPIRQMHVREIAYCCQLAHVLEVDGKDDCGESK
jgi:hypothetical protein